VRMIEPGRPAKRVAIGEECMPNYVFEIGLPTVDCADQRGPK
jgi:hypothetical protein